MSPKVDPGVAGYAAEAPALIGQYESLSFDDVHGAIAPLLPVAPSDVLDLGAGTGRDAAALAALGHRVVAVEPMSEFRAAAAILHPSPRIEWVDDSLPELPHIVARREMFDIVMLTAVWMHLDDAQRREAMPRVAALVRDSGLLAFSLRHGPIPAGRRMFDVTPDETIRLAGRAGLATTLLLRDQPDKRATPGVTWSQIVFSKSGNSA